MFPKALKSELESARATARQFQISYQQSQVEHKHTLARLQMDYETKMQAS
jgi:hypothetical protein